MERGLGATKVCGVVRACVGPIQSTCESAHVPEFLRAQLHAFVCIASSLSMCTGASAEELQSFPVQQKTRSDVEREVVFRLAL